ncbi:hypothetical protein P7C73_g1198, partial [Tremellales sp. Uapishka_1]
MPRTASPRQPHSLSPIHTYPTLPHTPGRRRTMTSPISPTSTFMSSPKSQRRASTSILTETDLSDGDEPEEWEMGDRTRKKRSKEEPMKPLAVVRRFLFLLPIRFALDSHRHAVYVVFFYLIWQILTRSDDTEILSHLSPTQQLRHLDHLPPNSYHLPYHMPQLPSPVPSAASGPGFWRLLLSAVIYPFYMILTIIAIPLPFLLEAVFLLLNLVQTILYPITATVRVMTRTFILTPWGLVTGLLRAFYPLYVFAAGVIGVGCVLGVGAGWIGKAVMNYVTGKPSKRSKRNTSSTKRGSTKSHSTLSVRSTPLQTQPPPQSRRRHSSSSSSLSPAPNTPVNAQFYSDLPTKSKSARGSVVFQDEHDARQIAKEPIVTGMRRRQGLGR